MSGHRATSTIVDGLRQMYQTGALSDFAIKVIPEDDSDAPRTFPVHKCLIACRSSIPVNSEQLVIHDTSPMLFEKLLLFIYTDEASMTEDIAVPLLHLSRKMHVKGLEAECFNFLINRLTLENVCTVFEEARLSQRSDVQEMCKDRIAKNPIIIQNVSLLTLSLCSLKELLSMDDLAVDESVVFSSLVSWATKECEKRGLDVNLRDVLGETVFTVRFIWLPDEFIGKVAASGLLSNDELSELLAIKASGKFPSKRFQVQKRNFNENTDSDVRTLFRFLEVQNYENSDLWEYDGDSNDAIALSVSKPVFLVGVTLYGPRETRNGLYRVLLELHNGTKCVQRLKTMILMKKSSITYPIKFSEPIKLFATHKYDIVLRLKGPSTYYGTLQTVDIPCFAQDGVTFTISNSQKGEVDRTDVHKGQIPEILYKLPACRDDNEKMLNEPREGL